MPSISAKFEKGRGEGGKEDAFLKLTPVQSFVKFSAAVAVNA